MALASPHANLASGDPAAQVARLQSLADGPVEHVPGLDGCQPERELVGKVVAGSPGPVALDEGGRPEVLEARARRRKRLATALCSSCCVLGRKKIFQIIFNLAGVFFYHGKTVAKPQWLPILWTVGNVHILAVNCDHIGLHLAHHTPEHIDCCISALYSDSQTSI